MSKKIEFGDFQTPIALAKDVTRLLEELGNSPKTVIEPNAGVGTFLVAAAEQWGKKPKYLGFEINPDYVEIAKKSLSEQKASILQRNFFEQDWNEIIKDGKTGRTLVLGNPPWVTNSKLGLLNSSNLPSKSNFQGLGGFEAQTGKSNFDIAEWILIKLVEALKSDDSIAMLCKTSTARKVLKYIWKSGEGRSNTKIFLFDANKTFGVAVDACLFYSTGDKTNNKFCETYADLSTKNLISRFGEVNGELVSDMDKYKELNVLDGRSDPYIWRSGLKHDASKVMEFKESNGSLVNGFGEIVDIEDTYLFPLLKSSDLANNRLEPKRFVLVTQKHPGEDTKTIKAIAPKTWSYLDSYCNILDGRKSSIYKKRPRFSVFGVGEYSFSPWKVAISGLYKNLNFVKISPVDNKPIMVDDTCYSIPCNSEDEAEFLVNILNSNNAKSFLNSIVFIDSKRPITIDILRRLSILSLAEMCNGLEELGKLMPNIEKLDLFSDVGVSNQ